MKPAFTVVAALLTSVWGASLPKRTANDAVWDLSNFKSLVTFGDSYTDEGRLSYFTSHNGSAPPVGTIIPESNHTSSGGYTWPHYVVQYTSTMVNGQMTPQLAKYNYAVSGAVCSNEITPRILASINADFPSVLEYEIPAFVADKASTRINTTEPYFMPQLAAADAVYTMWIGTNDLGQNCFLTDSQVPGKVLTDYTDCVYQALDELYATGARVFVLFNTIPLQLVPLYGNATVDGYHDPEAWPASFSNTTQIAETMHEYTTSVNDIFKYQTPFEALVNNRYNGASFAVFDVWQLISNIYDNPTEYLNGTEPATVTGYESHCNTNNTVCELEYNGTSPDSFLWYNTLHPSEQTDRIIARNFVELLNGASKYAAYY